MSRWHSLLVIALLAAQPGTLAKAIPHLIHHRSAPAVHAHSSPKKSLVTQHKQDVRTSEASDKELKSEVHEQSAVMLKPDGTEDENAPAGALYTDSDDCG